MLHKFLVENRQILIERCRAKASLRDSPERVAQDVDHGVAHFLAQLVAFLRGEAAGRDGERSAAERGAALHDQGQTVEQVVHGYGDVCQAITELAVERGASITTLEFSTLNRLLDAAIADAVSSYGRRRDAAGGQGARELHARLGDLADRQRVLVNTALEALHALREGLVGPRGNTAALLGKSLVELRDLIDRSHPEIRLATGMTTPPPS